MSQNGVFVRCLYLTCESDHIYHVMFNWADKLIAFKLYPFMFICGSLESTIYA